MDPEKIGTLFTLPQKTLKEYLAICATSKKNNQVMFIATNTPHSIHNGVALDFDENYIKLRNLEGVEVVVGWTPGIYVGLTKAKLAAAR